MLKKHMFPLKKGGQMDKHNGKGAKSETLPSRHAVAALTGGDPMSRTMQDYSKMTPKMGAPDTEVDPFSRI